MHSELSSPIIFFKSILETKEFKENLKKILENPKEFLPEKSSLDMQENLALYKTIHDYIFKSNESERFLSDEKTIFMVDRLFRKKPGGNESEGLLKEIIDNDSVENMQLVFKCINSKSEGIANFTMGYPLKLSVKTLLEKSASFQFIEKSKGIFSSLLESKLLPNDELLHILKGITSPELVIKSSDNSEKNVFDLPVSQFICIKLAKHFVENNGQTNAKFRGLSIEEIASKPLPVPRKSKPQRIKFFDKPKPTAEKKRLFEDDNEPALKESKPDDDERVLLLKENFTSMKLK